MLWKIYFWINLVLSLLGTVLILLESPPAFIDAVGLLWTGVTLIATYSYAYHKKILKPKYWKWAIWFLVFLVVESLIEIFALPPGFLEKTFPILRSNLQVNTGSALFGLVFMLPTYYATYKLSKAKH